jgi:hypothetical protein
MCKNLFKKKTLDCMSLHMFCIHSFLIRAVEVYQLQFAHLVFLPLLYDNWCLGSNHSLHMSKYAHTWFCHDEVWCNIIGCASFCYYIQTPLARPGSSPAGGMRATENELQMVQVPVPSVAHTGNVKVWVPPSNRQNLKDPHSSRSSDFKEKSVS